MHFYIFYIATFSTKINTKDFSVLHIFLGLWFGVHLHQRQIMSEIAPEDKRPAIFEAGCLF